MNDSQILKLEGFLEQLQSIPCDVPIPQRNEPKLLPVNGIVQPAVLPPLNRKGRITNLMKKFQTLLELMIRAKSSFQFRHPVNAIKLQVYEYHNCVHSPMDLYTVKKRLMNNYYIRAAEILEDLMLVFTNCRTFNSPDSPVFHDATALCNLLCQRLSKFRLEGASEFVEPPKVKGSKATQPPERNIFELPTSRSPPHGAPPSRQPIADSRQGRPRGQRAGAQAKAPSKIIAKMALNPKRQALLANELFAPSYHQAGTTTYDGTFVEHEIERSHCLHLHARLRASRHCPIVWSCNDSYVWEKCGENPYYEHDEEPLDWDISEALLVGELFVSFDWYLGKLLKMLENAMSCFAINPSVRLSVLKTKELIKGLEPKYRKRIAVAKSKAFEAVRLKEASH